MSRLSAVLLGLLLIATSVPTSTVAQGPDPWSLEASTGRVALEFSSEGITADEVGFTIDNRTGLVLLVGEEMAGILALLGLRTGYSQVATWQAGDGPIIGCPALGSRLLCDSTMGVALVPNPGRASLLARAPDAPGHTELTVMVGDRSLAFDLAIVAVGIGLSVVAPDVRGVPTKLVVDLALRILPEAGVAADAFMAGDIDGATRALAAAGFAATEAIKDHALDIGLAIVGNLVPHIATVKLMLAAARAVPAVFTLVAAMGNSERTTVRVGWDGVTVPEQVTRTDEMSQVTPDGGRATAILATGDGHTCFSDRDRIWCWGSGASGQLGAGSTEPSSIPVEVDGLRDISAISAGVGHTCAIANGSVWCWGAMGGGLGDGTTERSATPVRVDGLEHATGLASGRAHACALERGEVWCWGFGLSGELGEAGRENRASPVRVEGLSDVRSIAAGVGITCAISDAQVSCWGWWPIDNGGRATIRPVSPVEGLGAVDHIEVGLGQVCGLAEGRLSCLGSNEHGAIGDGTWDFRESPYRVDLPDGAQHVGAGDGTCAIAQGELWCWGLFDYAKENDLIWHPFVVPAIQPGAPRNATSVAVGRGHQCLIHDGHPWCWGFNNHGQLGDGTTSDRHEPTPVVGLPTRASETADLLVGWDARLLTRVSPPRHGRLTEDRPAVTHALFAEEGDEIGVAMRSSDFDAHLRVLTRDGSVLVENDDSGLASFGPTDAYAAFVAPARGTYFVEASSFQYANGSEPFGAGAYVIEAAEASDEVNMTGANSGVGPRLSGRFWEENWGKSHYDFFDDYAEYWITGSGILWTAEYTVNGDRLEVCPHDEAWCRSFELDGECIRRLGGTRYCPLDAIPGRRNP